MIRMTLDCVIPTQSIVMQIIHRNVDLKCFLNFIKMFLRYCHGVCIFYWHFTR